MNIGNMVCALGENPDSLAVVEVCTLPSTLDLIKQRLK